MDLFRSLGVAGWAWRSVLPFSFQPRIWIPFLLIALVQYGVLALFVSFHQPGVLPLALPLVKAAGGETATHYPFFYFYLPVIYSRANLLVAVFVSSLAGGAATLLFSRSYTQKAAKGAWGIALRKYLTHVMNTAVVADLLYGVSNLRRLVPADALLGNPMVRWGTRGGMMLLIILVQTLFVYATAWVVLRGEKAIPAIRNSVRVTARTFLPTFIVVALPAIVIFPFNYLTGRVDLFAGKLNPETIGTVIGVQILLEIFLGFLLVGAITRLFLWRLEPAK